MNPFIDFFMGFLNINIIAVYVIVAVIILRFVFYKAPKWSRMLLWSIVGIRLAIPFSLESKISLIPSSNTFSSFRNDTLPYVNSGFRSVDSAVNSYLADHYAEGVSVPANTLNDFSSVFELIWIIGIVAMLVASIVCYIRLKNSVKTAVLMRDNIYQCESVKTPFVLGIIKPKIYLPFHISKSEINYVVDHERKHIKHRDYLIKPFAFVLLSIYWINPLVWVSFFMLCKDIELICDERATKNYDRKERADYSQTLLMLSSPSRLIKICPVSFGEVGVKERVKAILNYKKPTIWAVISIVIVCVVAGVCFLTNPEIPKPQLNSEYNQMVNDAISEYLLHDGLTQAECIGEGHIVFGTEIKNDIVYAYSYIGVSGFGFENDELVPLETYTCPAVFEMKQNKYTDSNRLEIITVTYAEEGEIFSDSVKQLFPQEYRKYALNLPEKYAESIYKQQEKYANEYLESIKSP